MTVDVGCGTLSLHRHDYLLVAGILLQLKLHLIHLKTIAIDDLSYAGSPSDRRYPMSRRLLYQSYGFGLYTKLVVEAFQQSKCFLNGWGIWRWRLGLNISRWSRGYLRRELRIPMFRDIMQAIISIVHIALMLYGLKLSLWQYITLPLLNKLSFVPHSK
jgi:hypothetical protein